MLLRSPWFGALALTTSGGLLVLADYSTVEIFTDANCRSIPLVVTLEMINSTCTVNDTCVATEINDSAYYFSQRCATDRFNYTSSLFGSAKYLMIDGFVEEDCQSYVRSNVFLAAGTCQLASYVGTRSGIATLYDDGSAYMTIYNDSACGTEVQTFDLNASIIQDHTCYRGYNKFYTSDYTGIVTESVSSGNESYTNTLNTTTTTTTDSATSKSALVGIVILCIAIIILPALLIFWKVHRTRRKKNCDSTHSQTHDIALAVSAKRENGERYAPELSPRSDQSSMNSLHVGRLASARRDNELRCDPVRPDGLRGTPLHPRKEEHRSGKLWIEEPRSGGRLRSDRVRSESVGRKDQPHTDEFGAVPLHASQLQCEDLNDNAAHIDPVYGYHSTSEKCMRKERQRKERQRMEDQVSNAYTPSDVKKRDPRDPMRGVDLYSHQSANDTEHLSEAPVLEDQSEQPIHAQKLHGPITADSVCEDDAILSSRIPRDSVLVENLIGRGGYGEVYKGTYEGRLVAVKMLFPESRKSTRHVTEFLTEVKMMTVMDHPRVVEYVGVSWNNLMDLCVVTEFMAGGDLRAWLSDRADNGGLVGFDFTKVKIATHVVHALAYLHSLNPSVIHRDLKSRNILLSENQDAKLADFGASRERVDRTMTAGVGTSLWIAPEVMMGERYDEKADMFSFGVVLSELDSHQNPYAHAKENNSAGRKMPETAILQLVAIGKLRVKFSPGAHKGVVQLGMACTAIDPADRPTAAQALHKLQTVFKKEAKKVANVR